MAVPAEPSSWPLAPRDRKSTRLNSSHSQISYAVFCLKKKKTRDTSAAPQNLSDKFRLEAFILALHVRLSLHTSSVPQALDPLHEQPTPRRDSSITAQ